MGYLITIIFGFVGFGIGAFIPRISNQIIEFKLSQRQKQKEHNFLDQQKWVIFITLGNCLLWGIVGYFTPNILSGLLIGSLATLAIMFTVIDIIIHIIPNELLLVGLIIGVVFQLNTFGFKDFLIALGCMAALVVVFIIVGLVLGLNKIGAGDVKLAGLVGLILGYPHLIYALFVMSIALIIYIIVGVLIGKLTHVSMFAFGPFLMIGLISGLTLVLFPNLIVL